MWKHSPMGVNNLKHAGNNIESIIDGMQKDIQIKEAILMRKLASFIGQNFSFEVHR